MMMKFLVVLLLAICCVECKLSTRPGIKLALGHKFMEEMGHAAVYMCNRVLPGRTLPPVSGTKSKGYPKLQYTLSDLFVMSASCTSATAGPGSNDNEIKFHLTGVDMIIHSNLKAKQLDFPHLEPHGKTVATIKNGELTLVWDFGYNLTMTGSSVGSVSADLSYSGHDAVIIKPLLLFLKPFVDSIVEDTFSTITSEIFKNITIALQSAPDPLALNTPLPGVPDFQNDTVNFFWGPAATPSWRPFDGHEYFVLESVGQFVYAPPYTRLFNWTLPFSNDDDIPDAIGSDNLQIMLGTFTIDSFLYDLYHTHMSININGSVIPPSLPIKLNTTELKSILPLLYQRYPDAAISIDIRLGPYPTIKGVSNATIQVSAPIQMDWNVEVGYPVPRKTYVFTLNAPVTAVTSANIHTNPKNSSEWNIYGKLDKLDRIRATLVESVIGKFSLTKLNGILYDLGFIVPAQLNKILATGVSFPKKLRMGPFGFLTLNNFEWKDSPTGKYFALEVDAGFDGH
eukprot:TRINITY_DN68363_c0_g1_i1.p1 TRINITY_DN68363_c0_g1~~TRINITY_DN68363_c0_g1_i1.p1  ORF type:complete len:511 (+),score=67.93 TRINITY_DN68363_c0_g1_i1:26-1558(+)